MRERTYAKDPEAQIRAIVEAARPGDIILAHDVGADRRLVALRGLAAMIDGLRGRGFRFATVSELVAGGGTGSAHRPGVPLLSDAAAVPSRPAAAAVGR
jgi:peptidoglycan/xylan/chitin deacetylase (PgdA/CDA1 family)